MVIRFSQASGNREKEEGKMDAFKHINPKFLVWQRIIGVHNLSKTL